MIIDFLAQTFFFLIQIINYFTPPESIFCLPFLLVYSFNLYSLSHVSFWRIFFTATDIIETLLITVSKSKQPISEQQNQVQGMMATASPIAGWNIRDASMQTGLCCQTLLH